MQLEQQFDLATTPALAWPAFKDIALLVECLPGAALTGPAVDSVWPLRFDIKLGPIAAAFAGTGQVSFDETAQTGRFEGQAVDKRTQSRVKGAATFGLTPQGEGTRVQVQVDYTLAGSLAQFSRGAIVRELAGALTAQFARNLSARLSSVAPAADSTPASPSPVSVAHESAATESSTQLAASHTAAKTTTPTASAQPLRPLDLLITVLKARWQRWTQRLMRRPPP